MNVRNFVMSDGSELVNCACNTANAMNFEWNGQAAVNVFFYGPLQQAVNGSLRLC